TAIVERVATAMLNKGAAWGLLDRHDEEMTAYDQVVSYFGDSADPALQERVATAWINKAMMQGELDRWEAAIESYQQAIAVVGESHDSALRERQASAMLNLGVALEQVGREEAGYEVFRELISRFGAARATNLAECVAQAYNNLGYPLLLQAKKAWEQADVRHTLLTEARDWFVKALDYHPDDAVAMGNLGYTLFLNGQEDYALEPLQRALNLGGQALYQGTLADVATDTVPLDADFRALLERTWQAV
ncbi:MAG: tetratricopeptide repeat protein, partial [Betaproteobacteria bacterium]|nr:tetratricopeptide repeat protein [Betaproteobacteria bacterium]